MATQLKTDPAVLSRSDGLAMLRRQYGCGPVQFSGTDEALYERRLLFDDVVSPAAAGPRERFEALARSVRDVLSQRWVLTEETYERENPKRVYYLSMEFLLGRSLANNITNLMLGPVAEQAVRDKHLDLSALLEQEPDAGLGNGGLGRLAAFDTGLPGPSDFCESAERSCVDSSAYTVRAHCIAGMTRSRLSSV